MHVQGTTAPKQKTVPTAHPGQMQGSKRKKLNKTSKRAALIAEARSLGIPADELARRKAQEVESIRARCGPTIRGHVAPPSAEQVKAAKQYESR